MACIQGGALVRVGTKHCSNRPLDPKHLLGNAPSDTSTAKCSSYNMGVIALTLHANFTPFIDQLDNTFFLTFFPLPQDLHEDHEIPEDHIHFSDIRQTPTTNPRSGSLQVHYRAGPTTRLSSQSLWEPLLPDPSATLSETSLPQPPE